MLLHGVSMHAFWYSQHPHLSHKIFIWEWIYHNCRYRHILLITVYIQATGSIGDHFVSMLMEPRLLVFTDDGAISQMILCAKNEEIMEVPGQHSWMGVLHLMAAYYVYGVKYPKGCKSLLYFFQDFIIQKPDVARAARKRPTRYKTFTSQLHCNYSCSWV